MKGILRSLVRALLDPISTREELEAEQRWRANNAAARARGCPCGDPATRVRLNHGTVGRVPQETWTCAAHERVESWRTISGPGGTRVIPLWGRPAPCVTCPGTCSRMGPIGGPPNRWFCPQQPDGTEQR